MKECIYYDIDYFDDAGKHIAKRWIRSTNIEIAGNAEKLKADAVYVSSRIQRYSGCDNHLETPLDAKFGVATYCKIKVMFTL